MLTPYKHRLEHRVDTLKRQVELPISLNEAHELLRTGGYHKDIGWYRGEHYRKVRGRGCYHLRIHDGRAWLHWDGRDPRRDLIGHIAETPQLKAAVGLTILGIGIAIVARSSGKPGIQYDPATNRYRDSKGRFRRKSGY